MCNAKQCVSFHSYGCVTELSSNQFGRQKCVQIILLNVERMKCAGDFRFSVDYCESMLVTRFFSFFCNYHFETFVHWISQFQFFLWCSSNQKQSSRISIQFWLFFVFDEWKTMLEFIHIEHSPELSFQWFCCNFNDRIVLKDLKIIDMTNKMNKPLEWISIYF